jgi:hypothetical protein
MNETDGDDFEKAALVAANEMRQHNEAILQESIKLGLLRS